MGTASTAVSGACPTPSELAAFAAGAVDAPRFERVAEHVSGCPPCGRALERLDCRGDALVEGLAALGSSAPGPAAPPPDELVSAALSARGRAALDELAADPGLRIARDLARSGDVRLGRFELVREVGSGSFGHVFEARDTELDRTVAIKVGRAGALDRAEERERFLREARSAAQLAHPGIVALHEVGETDGGVCFLVTEFVRGETLEERLARGRLEPRRAAELTAEIARALAAAHARGVIHRDVKPSNVMLDRDGRPHVMDFGLAKRETGEVTVTPDGALLGTPAYMSPEIARGAAHAVDARADVYSLGVVLYELLTGERPFQGARRMLVLQVLEDEPRPPRRLDDRIPRDLETICLKAMAKAPARRYAGALELAQDLERFLAGRPIRARALGPAERLARWCGRNRLAVGLIATIVLGSAVGFVHLTRLSRELVESAAVESAAQYAEMLEVVNALYSSEVVDRVGGHGIAVTAGYAATEGSIPLPATLLTELLECISTSETGMRGRHYSDHPFRTRPDGGPRTEFERAALRHLERSPDEPYYRFVDDGPDGPALLYATARIMSTSCVECHNRHPDSTKRDWRPGDVRGVLEIVRPLGPDVARTRAGLRGTFVLVGVVSVLLLGLTASAALVGERRRRARTEEP